MQDIEKLKLEIEKLQNELLIYKSAYSETICYFDSIDEKEQKKLNNRLNKIFKNLNK